MLSDQDDEDAARVMADHKIRRLPVLSRDDKLVDIVLIGDLASKAHAGKHVGSAMEDVA